MKKNITLLVLLFYSIVSLCQKIDKCQLKEYSIINDSAIINEILGISYSYGKDFQPVNQAMSGTILSHTYADLRKSDSSHIVSVDYDKKSGQAVIFHVSEKQVEGTIKQMHLKISKNIFVGLQEDMHFKKYLEKIESMGLYFIHKDENLNAIHTYQDTKGLWWYYVKYSEHENSERVSYVAIKNYNRHLVMAFYFTNLTTEENIIKYLEQIKIWGWNNELDLKRSKRKCE